jgi:dsRNA-specific ribonuclease
MRSWLICNKTLNSLSLRYGFDKRLRAVAVDAPRSTTKENKIRADVFEAYIAGLYWYYERARGPGEAYLEVSNWLRAVFRPLACWTYFNILRHRIAPSAVGPVGGRA